MTTAPSALETLSARTCHVVIDMQRLFAERGSPWHTPALAGIVAPITRLAASRPQATLFARFITPQRATDAPGRWRRYYARWDGVVGTRLAPGMLDLVPGLAALASPQRTVDKATFSLFEAPGFAARLEAEGTDTLVLSGVETDVCVLATLLDAVDRGFRVVVATDGVASGSPEAHAAVLSHLLPRLSDQVDLATADDILAAWRA